MFRPISVVVTEILFHVAVLSFGLYSVARTKIFFRILLTDPFSEILLIAVLNLQCYD